VELHNKSNPPHSSITLNNSYINLRTYNKMKVIYESNYQTFNLNKKKSYLIAIWSEKSEKIVNEDFKNEMYAELEYVEKYQAKNYLIDTFNFRFIITPTLQEWTDQHINTKLDELGLQKLAYIVSEDFVSQLSIKQTMDESKKENYATRFFTSCEEAEAWLLD